MKNETFSEARQRKYGFRDKRIGTKNDSEKGVKATGLAEKATHAGYEKIVDVADSAAKASRIVAVTAVAGAWVAAPTGLSAVGVALGVVSAPAIVTVAPMLVAIAGGAAAVSAAASLYSKFKRNKNDGEK